MAGEYTCTLLRRSPVLKVNGYQVEELVFRVRHSFVPLWRISTNAGTEKNENDLQVLFSIIYSTPKFVS